MWADASSLTNTETIEIRTLTDGGQSGEEVLGRIDEFLAGARRSLDLAHYDLNVGPANAERLARSDPRGRRARCRSALPLQRRPPEPDPGAAAAGAGRAADRVVRRARESDRRRAGPDAPQVRRARRRIGLDRLDELDRRLVHAPGERRCDGEVAGARNAVRRELRGALVEGSGRAERARAAEPGSHRRAEGARVVHTRVRRGALDAHREGDRALQAARSDLLAGDHGRAGALDRSRRSCRRRSWTSPAASTSRRCTA